MGKPAKLLELGGMAPVWRECKRCKTRIKMIKTLGALRLGNCPKCKALLALF